MKNKILLVMLGLLVLITSFSMVSACSCIYLPDTQAKYNNAQVVFSGKIKEIEYQRTGYAPSQEYIATFEKYDSWKMESIENSNEIAINGWKDNGANCGYNLEDGKEYLVFAFIDSEGKAHINSCNAPILLSEAQSAIDDLNEMGAPVNPPQNNTNSENEEQSVLSRFFSWLRNLFS